MTIKKQWLGTIIGVVLIGIFLNSWISSGFINAFFSNYIQDTYDRNVEKILSLSSGYLEKGSLEDGRLTAELNNFLEDPIKAISLQNMAGQTLALVEGVQTERQLTMHGMKGMGMMRQDGHADADEVVDLETLKLEQFPILKGEVQIGTLGIYHEGTIQSSETVLLFRKALWIGSMISGVIAIGIALFTSIFVTKRMTKDLRTTAEFATTLDETSENVFNPSKIREISAIQNQLVNIGNKLKLEKSIQKERVDQLVHDARTPLTILQSHLEGVQDEVVEMDEKRLNSCLHETQQLSHLMERISQLLTYQYDPSALDISKFDLSKELEVILNGMSLQFEHKKMTVVRQLPPHLWLETDRMKLSQTIYNVLTNAYKFTPEGGHVVVNAQLEEKNPPSFVIEIRNSGGEIDALDQAQLFNAYYRSPKMRAIPGEGLGLFISKKNMEAISGTIELKSSSQEGTVFQISGPIRLSSLSASD